MLKTNKVRNFLADNRDTFNFPILGSLVNTKYPPTEINPKNPPRDPVKIIAYNEKLKSTR